MKRSDFFLFFFVVVILTELATLIFHWEFLETVTKPLIMLSLAGYYLAKVEQRDNQFLRALFFCWAGDVLLMFQTEGEMFFMLGLVAFLLGHMLYIFCYRRMRWSDSSKGLLVPQKIRYAFPVVLAATSLVTILFPYLGGLKGPVLIYALVLMFMVLTALFRYGRTTTGSFWMIFAGAALFMISDSLLAINKFYSPVPQSGLAIMSAYIGAQYLIVRGVLKHV